MKKKSRMLLAAILALALTLCVGCQQSTAPDPAVPSPAAEPSAQTPEPEAATATDEKVKLAFVAAEVGIPYFTTMQWGAMDAAEDFNVDLNFTGPAEWDLNKQMPFIDGALALSPQGIIIVPTDQNSLVTYAKQWMDAGIGVISVDVPLAEHVDLVGFESNQYSGGVAAAEAMFAVTKGEGTYLTMGTTPGAFGAMQRCAGFIDRMKELNPNVKLLDTVYPHHDARKASEMASAAIMGTPDLTGIFVATSGPASGVSSAIIEAGKTGVVRLVSFDADPQQVADLKEGVYDVLIAQDPYQMGYDSVMKLAKYVRGELKKEDFPDAVENYTMMALTRENVDSPESEQYKCIGDLQSRPERKK